MSPHNCGIPPRCPPGDAARCAVSRPPTTGGIPQTVRHPTTVRGAHSGTLIDQRSLHVHIHLCVCPPVPNAPRLRTRRWLPAAGSSDAPTSCARSRTRTPPRSMASDAVPPLGAAHRDASLGPSAGVCARARARAPTWGMNTNQPIGPESIKRGPMSVEVGRTWAEFGQAWGNFGMERCPHAADAGRTLGPELIKLGPTPGPLRRRLTKGGQTRRTEPRGGLPTSAGQTWPNWVRVRRR